MERQIKELKAYEHNPRKMTKEDFTLLQDSLKEFGDLSGVIFNRTTGHLVGGHQRTNHFKQEDAKVILTEEYPEASPTGTIAVGYIVNKGEKYAYREVEWEEEKEKRANILANKVSGQWDFDILANNWDVDELLSSGWKAGEIGFATSREEDGTDTDELGSSMETYLAGNVKQISLMFSSEEFEEIMPRIDAVMQETGATSNTEVFIKLLDFYEGNKGK